MSNEYTFSLQCSSSFSWWYTIAALYCFGAIVFSQLGNSFSSFVQREQKRSLDQAQPVVFRKVSQLFPVWSERFHFAGFSTNILAFFVRSSKYLAATIPAVRKRLTKHTICTLVYGSSLHTQTVIVTILSMLEVPRAHLYSFCAFLYFQVLLETWQGQYSARGECQQYAGEIVLNAKQSLDYPLQLFFYQFLSIDCLKFHDWI